MNSPKANRLAGKNIKTILMLLIFAATTSIAQTNSIVINHSGGITKYKLSSITNTNRGIL